MVPRVGGRKLKKYLRTQLKKFDRSSLTNHQPLTMGKKMLTQQAPESIIIIVNSQNQLIYCTYESVAKVYTTMGSKVAENICCLVTSLRHPQL
jgi:hypothetical protein